MSIQRKTVTTMSVVLVVALGVIFGAMHLVIGTGITAFEDRVVVQTVRRAAHLVDDSRNEVLTHTAGYAVWDEMQRFVRSADPAVKQAFVASNFTPQYWKTFNVDVFTIKDAAGNDVFQVAYDDRFVGEAAVPDSMRAIAPASGIVWGATEYPAEGRSGLWFDRGESALFVIAASPILDSTGNGPSAGTAVFARRIGPQTLSHLSRVGNVELALYRADDAAAHGLTPDRKAAADRGAIAVGPRSATRSTGWIRLPVVNDAAGAYLRVSTDRSAAHQAEVAGRSMLGAALLLGVVLVVVVLILLRRLVLGRLDRFSQEVRGLVADSPHGGRLTVDGSDELARLGRDVNELLDRIDLQRDRTQLLVDGLPLVAYVLSADGHVISANARAQQIFGAPLLGAPLTAFVPPDEAELETAALADLRRTGTMPRDREFTTVGLAGLAEPTEWMRRLAPLGGSALGEPGAADQPGAAFAVGLWVDISDRFRADAERQAKEAAEQIAAELERTTAELAAVLRSATSVKENERRRIAAALHDDTVQVLSAALWQLDDLRDARAAGADASAAEMETYTDAGLVRASTALTQAIEATRSITFMIDPPGLRDLGLARVVVEVAAQFGSRTGLAVTSDVDLDLGTDPDRPTLDVEARVLRTIRESLANVARHAQAQHVVVGLTERGRWIDGFVRDDGVGTDEVAIASVAGSRHLGVSSMRSDIRSMGGRFAIVAAPGCGTDVRFSVPLTEDPGASSAPRGVGSVTAAGAWARPASPVVADDPEVEGA